MMEPESEKPKSSLPPPHIPPPNLTPPPPSPRSPLDQAGSAAETPADPAARVSPVAKDGPVKVNLHVSAVAEEADGLAPLNPRLIAFVIDSVVTFGLAFAAWLVLPNVVEGLAWLLGIGYLVTRDSLPFLEGQSVGKKAMKLKAVTTSGASLAGNWELGLIRNGVLVIPFFALIELYILMTREEKPEQGRRLGDEWAKTKVITVPDTAPAE